MTTQTQKLADDLAKAADLLQRCLHGFSAYINGRKMARKDRDALRNDIDDFLDGLHRILNPHTK